MHGLLVMPPAAPINRVTAGHPGNSWCIDTETADKNTAPLDALT